MDLGNLFQSLGNGLNSFFRGAVNSPSGTLTQFNPSSGGNYLSNLNQPTAPPTLRITPQQVQQGINNFAPNTPIATMSGQFAQAGNMLPPTVPPNFPAVIALMESQGGLKQAGMNDPFGIMSRSNGMSSPANYPDPTTALMGGGPNNQQGFMGTLLHSGSYNPFLQSGNPADFFNTWTPPGSGNPSLIDLLMRYNAINSLFPTAGGQQ